MPPLFFSYLTYWLWQGLFSCSFFFVIEVQNVKVLPACMSKRSTDHWDVDEIAAVYPTATFVICRANTKTCTLVIQPVVSQTKCVDQYEHVQHMHLGKPTRIAFIDVKGIHILRGKLNAKTDLLKSLKDKTNIFPILASIDHRWYFS